ncbi:major facilitator superfamily domain-containing protein [Xylariaceae sp. FL0016]|nr:major facilitator superfamily domain-containing protein [Xylariaceae sp. FL0016]
MVTSSRRTSDTAVHPPSTAPQMANDDAEQPKGATPPSAPDPEQGTGPKPPGGPPDPSEALYQPKTFQFWSVLFCVFLGLFIVALDRTILGTATPQITRDFHSLGDIGWYGSAYQLTTAASQLLFGRIYTFYEAKRTFLVTVLIFEIGSAICGAAPSSIVFIIGRAIAGVGGAGIFSGVQVAMVYLVPLRKRPMFQGLFGMIFGTASVLGPLVGGAFTEGVSWRWCFYINLPIGAVATICLIFMLHLPKKKPMPATLLQQVARLDPLGTFFFVPSIVCLLIALEWGGSEYSWGSWRIILLLAVFAVLLFAFGAVQVLLPENATVPVRIIKNRSILAGAIYMIAIAGSMLLTVYYLPIWFQVVQGVSAFQSGVHTLPFVLSLVVASILSGIVTNKIGYYVPSMIISPSMLAIGQGLMSTFKVGESSSHWIGFQVIAGLGLGIGMQASTLAAQAVLPMKDIKMGIAIMFFAQQLGGGVFTSVGQNLLSSYLVSHLTDIPGLDPSQITSEGAGVANIDPKYQGQVRAVYNDAISRIFLCAMGIALIGVLAALCMEWKNIKKMGPPGPPGGKPPQNVVQEPKEKDAAPAGNQPLLPGHDSADDSDDIVALFKKDPLEKPMPRAEIFRMHGSPRSSREFISSKPSGCDHCEHCRLSRAITIAPSEQGSRLSRQSLVTPTGTPNPTALEEAARLAGIARDAVAQLEELTRPFSVMAQQSGMHSANRLSIESRPDAHRRRSVPTSDSSGRDPRRNSANRRPTVQDLVSNANRVSAQLERESRESTPVHTQPFPRLSESYPPSTSQQSNSPPADNDPPSTSQQPNSPPADNDPPSTSQQPNSPPTDNK